MGGGEVMECVGVWLVMAPDDRRGLGLKGLPLPARDDGGNGKGGTPTLLGDILGEPKQSNNYHSFRIIKMV